MRKTTSVCSQPRLVEAFRGPFVSKHCPLLLYLGSAVLVISTAPSSLTVGLAVAWRILCFGPRGCQLIAVFVEGRGYLLTARLCLVPMTCFVLFRAGSWRSALSAIRRILLFCYLLEPCCLCMLRWALCFWFGTVPWLGWVAPLHLVCDQMLWSRRCLRHGFLVCLTGKL